MKLEYTKDGKPLFNRGDLLVAIEENFKKPEFEATLYDILVALANMQSVSQSKTPSADIAR